MARVEPGMPGPVSAATTPSGRTGVLALSLALIALIGSVIASGVVAAVIGSQPEVRAGDYLRLGAGDRILVIALLATQLLWAILGLAGLITGIVAIVRRAGRPTGIAAIIIALPAPAISFLVFRIVLLLTT